MWGILEGLDRTADYGNIQKPKNFEKKSEKVSTKKFFFEICKKLFALKIKKN